MEDLPLRCGPQHGQMPPALGRQFQEHRLQVPEARPVSGVQAIEVGIERRDAAIEDTQPSATLDISADRFLVVQIQWQNSVERCRQHYPRRENDLLDNDPFRDCSHGASVRGWPGDTWR